MVHQAKVVCKGMYELLCFAQDHRGAYETAQQQQPTNGNTIVHVSTHEFFFYPPYAPFDYNIFHKHIEVPLRTQLQTLPSWLTFHFGTLPIQMTTGEFNGQTLNQNSFVNAALYGSGGKQSILKFYSKKHHHYPRVQSTTLFMDHIQIPGDPYVTTLTPEYLNLSPIFVSRTEAGQTFIMTFEICLDHAHARALKEYYQFIHEAAQSGIQVPSHGVHEVTSNIITIQDDNIVFTVTSLSDPVFDRVIRETLEKRFFSVVPILKDQPSIEKTASNSWVSDTTAKIYQTLSMEKVSRNISENNPASPSNKPKL